MFVKYRFTKQAGDAFLFGTAVATNVSQADKITIYVSTNVVLLRVRKQVSEVVLAQSIYLWN